MTRTPIRLPFPHAAEPFPRSAQQAPSGASEVEELLPPARPVQLLDETGALHEDARYPLDLTDDDLVALYRHMVVARRVDEQSIRLQRKGQLGLYASLRGQEGAEVGTAFALADQDWVFPTYRELAVCMVRGLEPVHVLHLYRGTWLSGHDPHAYRIAPLAISIGTHTLHAAGYAMAAKLDGSDLAVAAYCGDGATSTGDVHEAWNFAAVYGAPCVFVVQNNQYAISVPRQRQSRAPTLAHKAVGYGMPGYLCDGNDVLASYAVMRRALERARSGGGPALIEALTYRMEAHTTADDAARYRGEDELAHWRELDPITRLERLLTSEGLLDEQLREEIAAAGDAAARRAREEITDAPHGDPLELFEHVWGDPPPHLLEQREQLRAELAAGEEAAS